MNDLGIRVFRRTVALLLCIIGSNCASLAQGPGCSLIQSGKPPLFISVDGEHTDRKSVRLRINNNNNCPISVETTTGAPMALVYPVEVPISVHYFVQKDGHSGRQQGYVWPDTVLSFEILGGESILFTVPKEQLKRYSTIIVPFNYEWEDQKTIGSGFGDVSHFISFSIAMQRNRSGTNPGTSSDQNELWKEIVTLRSTRAEVEKMMGKGEEHAFIAYYPVKNGGLHIEYSDGRCRPGQYRGWKVPEGTVIELVYAPFNSPPVFSSFHLDISKFRITRESPDVPELITYICDDEGIAYTVQLDGTVSEIRYFQATQYERLRCSK
jgi:hypothetical protein